MDHKLSIKGSGYTTFQNRFTLMCSQATGVLGQNSLLLDPNRISGRGGGGGVADISHAPHTHSKLKLPKNLEICEKGPFHILLAT